MANKNGNPTHQNNIADTSLDTLLNSKIKEAILQYIPFLESLVSRKDDDDIITTSQLRQQLNISKVTEIKYRKQNKIKFVQVGAKIWYLKKDVNDFLQNQSSKNI